MSSFLHQICHWRLQGTFLPSVGLQMSSLCYCFRGFICWSGEYLRLIQMNLTFFYFSNSFKWDNDNLQFFILFGHSHKGLITKLNFDLDLLLIIRFIIMSAMNQVVRHLTTYTWTMMVGKQSLLTICHMQGIALKILSK